MHRQLAIVLLASASFAAAQTPEVDHIFKTRCIGCHATAKQIGGLPKATLLDRVTGKPGIKAMPPVGPRLTAKEVASIQAWLDQASQKRHWAFEPVREPAVLDVDTIVLARLRKEGIEPSPEADKRTLLRRLSLDLTGLPPSPEQLNRYINEPYDRVVDRLLASPHFGERWARPWLDRARYADSDGYEKDWVRPWAWRYRTWVIEALNADMPFDRFAVEQIAGDLAGAPIATGFHRQTLTNREGGIDNNQFKFEAALDRTNTVASAFLGLTAGCAQCHDHKYDPFSQRDYFQLFAFFENIVETDVHAPLPGETEAWAKVRDEYSVKRGALLKQYNVSELQADWEQNMLQAAAEPGKRTDWDLAWDCLLKLTEGGDDGERIIRVPLEKRTDREREVLTTHFIRNYHFAVGQKRWKELKLDELDKKLKALYDEYPQLSMAMTVTEGEDVGPHHLRVRGDYRTNGMEVQRATPSVLAPLKSQGPTRLDLAHWIASKDNPLTARVTVNWVWQEMFGRGIVRTAEDFGTRGDAPSHPELLDSLAWQFTQNGWSLKKLIRTIATSATYKQSSKIRPDVQAKDPENALLARQSRLRLPAELIRDSALHAAGLLSHEVGGRSVRPPQPDGVASLAYGAKTNDSWKESTGKDRYRRGLYIHFQRATPYPLLMNFDAPKAVVAQCRRERSNTALQALNLLNDPVFFEAAEALARRVAGEADPITAMFEYALGRPPSPAEAERFARHSGDLTLLASVLLNLDEFITRE
ncbi:MAG TPA: DUF1553 domain-containing protein [Bryobacteraceae bacterium]|nr:DUF1553 domain-containing protein [Bryobacteraceae bacterium]